MAKSKVSAKEFIKIWQTSDTRQEVMEQTGLSYNAVSSRAYRYMKHGIPLKPLNGSLERLDYDELANYAEQVLSEEPRP